MPNIKSAKKRVKTDAKKGAQNKSFLAGMRTEIKKTRKEVKNGDKEKATEQLKVAVKKIDKAASGKLIKKEKAARDKSKLMKAVNEIK